MARSYGQHCALAHALDLVGERWTLLIVRELLASPLRYTDLAAGLGTIPSNLLASRLRELEGAGLVRRRRLAPPAGSVVVYELTPAGERLGPAVTELARWGMRSLSGSDDEQPLRANWLVLALRARFDADAAAGLSESYEFRIVGEDPVCFDVTDGTATARVGAAVDPAVRVTADARTLAALADGAIADHAPADSVLAIDGEQAAVDRMLSVLSIGAVRAGRPTPS